MKPVDHFALAEQNIAKASDMYRKNAPLEHVSLHVQLAGVHAQLAHVQQEKLATWTGEAA